MKYYILFEKHREKQCNKCDRVLPANREYFSPKKRGVFGLDCSCKTCCTKKSMEYYKLNKDTISPIRKIYRENNKTTLTKKKSEYYFQNKSEIRIKNTKRTRERRQNNPLVKLKDNISSLIRISIKNKGYSKTSRTYEMLGCSFEEFKTYIESKFEPWMNWENYGKYNGKLNFGWNYDHIIPVCTATNEKELLLLNHYTNFQPLCSKVNRDIKRANY